MSVAIIIISDSAFTIMPLIYLRTRPAGTLRHHYVGVANPIALLLRHVEELFLQFMLTTWRKSGEYVRRIAIFHLFLLTFGTGARNRVDHAISPRIVMMQVLKIDKKVLHGRPLLKKRIMKIHCRL